MPDRLAWLQDRLQEAYDGETFESDGLTIDCHMVYGRKGVRRLEAVISFEDRRDGPVDLAGAVDRAMKLRGDA